MSQLLRPFPGSLSVVSRIEADVVRHPGHVDLKYRVSGDVGALVLPAFAASARTDELWQHTCFEAFIRPLPQNAYFEFNFAPSTQWAAYGFSTTRQGMHNIGVSPQRIEAEQGDGFYTLDVLVDLAGVPALLEEQPWRLNITAVIEEKDGRKSYWALAHPPGKPDFHQPDCFVLELPAA